VDMQITIHLRFCRNQENMTLFIRYHICLHEALDPNGALNLANVHKYKRPKRLCSIIFISLMKKEEMVFEKLFLNKNK